MQNKPRILLINDDGIDAEGLRYLWQALHPIGDLYIIAPAIEQSGSGVGITLRSPLLIEPVEWENNTPAWKVRGTPADCVKMAVSKILPFKPDLIVSGINRGSNSGKNIFYSGTVGGVIEGVLRDIPGIAFSLACEGIPNPNYNVPAKYISSIVQHVLDEPLPRGTFLNVNFPTEGDDIVGFKLARQGKGYWLENLHERLHPDGKPYYWLGGVWNTQEEHEESDVHYLQKGYMTAVPIHIEELTCHGTLEGRKDTFENLFHKTKDGQKV